MDGGDDQGARSDCSAVPTLNVPDVLDVSFATYRESRCLKPADGELDTIEGHYFVRHVSQVCDDL